MSTTDTSERALESPIVAALTGRSSADPTTSQVAQDALPHGPPATSRDATRTATATMPLTWRSSCPSSRKHNRRPWRRSTWTTRERRASSSSTGHRLQDEIAKRGVIDMLRKGVKHGPASVGMLYGAPTPR